LKIILWHVNFLFCLAKTNNTLILPNISLKLILSKCSTFSHWHLIAMFGGCVFPDGRHTYGYKLGTSSHWRVPFFVRGIIHTEVSQEKRKEASLGQNGQSFVPNWQLLSIARCRSKYEVNLAVPVVSFISTSVGYIRLTKSPS
jgi:hypothetical protein